MLAHRKLESQKHRRRHSPLVRDQPAVVERLRDLKLRSCWRVYIGVGAGAATPTVQPADDRRTRDGDRSLEVDVYDGKPVAVGHGNRRGHESRGADDEVRGSPVSLHSVPTTRVWC